MLHRYATFPSSFFSFFFFEVLRKRGTLYNMYAMHKVGLADLPYQHSLFTGKNPCPAGLFAYGMRGSFLLGKIWVHLGMLGTTRNLLVEDHACFLLSSLFYLFV